MKVYKKKTTFGSFHYTLYKRVNGIYYFRVIHDETQSIIGAYSTRLTSLQEAREEATRQFKLLDLEQVYRSFSAKKLQTPSKRLRDHGSHSTVATLASTQQGTSTTAKIEAAFSALALLYTTEELQKMTVAEYVRAFWDPKRSPYIQDRINMRKPLSGKYLYDNNLNVTNYFETDHILRNLPIRSLQYTDLEGYVRRLIAIGKTPYMLRHILDALRTPLSWGAIHAICDNISFKKLPIPSPEAETTRGILSDDELNRIIALDAVPIWFSRSGTAHVCIRPIGKRLTKEDTEHPTVYLREKLYVLLGLYLGARRGELRALRWKQLDFDNGLIYVKENFVPHDPIKEPKAKSKRVIVMPQRLRPILEDAFATARILGADDPESFVLINEHDSHQPVGENIDHSWAHVLRAIGISEKEQKARHLVFHGSRHYYVTKLLDAGLTPHQVGKLSGHRVLKTIERYGDHTTQEALDRAKKALDRPANGSKEGIA